LWDLAPGSASNTTIAHVMDARPRVGARPGDRPLARRARIRMLILVAIRSSLDRYDAKQNTPARAAGESRLVSWCGVSD
jgi:hypothetical protein